MLITQKVSTCLWFDDQAEEACNFYTSLFKNSKITSKNYYSEESKKVRVINFELDGQEFMALNGGPHFTFSPAISLYVNCENQEEVDELWEKLSEGGEKGRCGWLKDKYGLSWQIVPNALIELMKSSNSEQSKNVMEELLKMNKLDIKTLKQAYERV